MFQTRRLSRFVLATGFFALGACAFIPTDEQGAATVLSVTPAAPNAAAQRLPSLQTRRFELTEPGQELIGETQLLFTNYENTFAAIAREYDLGYEELKDANPGVDHWLPGEGTPVYLPTLSILPDAPRVGIVLNLPSMRLLYFSRSELESGAGVRALVTSHPIGIGREGWATPTGTAAVTGKARDPVWYVPASVRAEHSAIGDPLPSVVPPGPDNPLGRFAIGLSMPGYLIHGTNKPSGVGMRVSHGCIRLYPEDIEALFGRVPSGTPVSIVDQPVLAGWRGGKLFLEVHRPLAEDERDLLAEAYRIISAAMERAAKTDLGLDHDAVQTIVAEQRGIPFPVLQSGLTRDQYLAAARVIENTVPIVAAKTTARTD